MNDNHRPDAAWEAIEEADERLGAPIEKRTVAMIAVALVVLPFVLYAGAAFFIPLFVSLFMSYALSPVVDWMERCRVPRAVGAAVTMLLVTALAALGVQQALSGTTEVLEELPQAVQKLRYAVTSWERDGKGGALKQVQKTADELQKLAGASAAVVTSATPRRRARARTARPNPRRSSWRAPIGMAIFVGQLVSVLFLTYFLLAAGDLFRRRLMQVMEPSLAARKKALQILRQVHELSQRYFALVLAMNITVGLVTAAGLYLARRSAPGVLGHRDGHPAHDSVPRRGGGDGGGGPHRLSCSSEARRHALAAAAVPLGAVAADRHLAADRTDGPHRANECGRRLRRAALLRHGLGRLGPAAGVPDHGDDQDRVRRDRAPEARGAADG